MKTLNTISSVFCAIMLVITVGVFLYMGSLFHISTDSGMLSILDDLEKFFMAIFWSAIILVLFVTINTIVSGSAFCIQLVFVLVKKAFNTHSMVNLSVLGFLLGWPYILWLLLIFISWIST